MDQFPPAPEYPLGPFQIFSNICEEFASQGAPLASMKPVANLTLGANFATSFASVGVNDTGGNFPPVSRTPAGKFATGVNDTGGK